MIQFYNTIKFAKKTEYVITNNEINYIGIFKNGKILSEFTI